MKKKFIKGLLIAMLVMAGTYSSSKVFAQVENPTGWRTVVSDQGYWYQGVWVHVRYCTLCGSGTDFSCSPTC
jgi:hypothetical protein